MLTETSAEDMIVYNNEAKLQQCHYMNKFKHIIN